MGDWTPLSTPAGAAGRWQRVRMALPGQHSPPAMKLTVGYCRFLILSVKQQPVHALALLAEAAWSRTRAAQHSRRRRLVPQQVWPAAGRL